MEQTNGDKISWNGLKKEKFKWDVGWNIPLGEIWKFEMDKI